MQGPASTAGAPGETGRPSIQRSARTSDFPIHHRRRRLMERMPLRSVRCRAAWAASRKPPASASRNMVLQNGQAAATTPAPVADQFLGALHADALPFLLAEKRQPSACSATERTLARPRRIDQSPEFADHIARLIVDVAISAQIAGIVINDLLARSGVLGQTIQMPRQKLAVMLDRRCLPVLRPIRARWYARNADRWR